METKEKIVILRKLQELDRQLAHYRRMKEFEPKRLAGEEAQVAAEEARLAGLGDKHGHVQRDISRKELDIKIRQEKVNRLKSQMLSASTNKEYQAFLKEVSLEEVEKHRVEDELLEMMISTESYAAEEAATKKAIAESRKGLETVRAEVKAALVEAATREGEIAKSRDSVAAELDPDSLRRYDGLFRTRGGEAVINATFEPGGGGEEGQYLCRGCFMPLTHQMINLLIIGKEIINCKSCGRILYIEDNKEE